LEKVDLDPKNLSNYNDLKELNITIKPILSKD
jgi:hypothetical protein